MEPHVYKAGSTTTAIFLCVAAIMGVFGAVLLVISVGPQYFGFPVEMGTSANPFRLVLGPVALGVAAYMVVATLTRRIVLYPDAIEEKTALPWGRRRMERYAIAGKQVMKGVVTMYLLFPKDPAGKIFSVTGRNDPYFLEWMAQIPDRIVTGREASIRW